MSMIDDLKTFTVSEYVNLPDLGGYKLGVSFSGSSSTLYVDYYLIDGSDQTSLKEKEKVNFDDLEKDTVKYSYWAVKSLYQNLPLPETVSEKQYMEAGGKKLAYEIDDMIKDQAKKSWPYIIHLWEDKDQNKYELRAKTARILKDKYHFVTPKDSKHLYRFENGFYRSDGEEFILKLLENKIGALDTNSGIEGIIDRIKRLSFVERREMKPPKHLILCENGILNWKEEEMEKPNPDYFFTNKLPVKYDPKAECPKFKSFLEDLELNKKERRTIFAGIGLSLIADYPIKRWFLFYGEGDNGKTTLLNLIGDFLGEENVAHQPLQDICNEKWATSRLVGKLANIKGDLRGDELKKTSKLKQLTGGDRGIKAQRKYEPEFTFNNYAVLWFSANQIPKTKEDKSRGFYLRTVPIKFPVCFVNNPDKDDPMEKPKELNIEDKILTEEEKSGILNEAIKELKWTLKKGKLPFHRDWKTKKEIWEKQSDLLYRFIHEKLETDGDWVIKRRELYNVYSDWMDGLNQTAMDNNVFQRKLKGYVSGEMYKPKIGGKQVKCWKGIRYKEDSDIRSNWVGLKKGGRLYKNLRPEQVHRWSEKGNPLPSEPVNKGEVW